MNEGNETMERSADEAGQSASRRNPVRREIRIPASGPRIILNPAMPPRPAMARTVRLGITNPDAVAAAAAGREPAGPQARIRRE